MIEENLKLLEQNLLKKHELLDRMQEVYDKQSDFLENSEMNPEDFDICMDDQDELLQELNALNEESEELYESLRLSDISVDGPYALQIERLKTLIAQMMNKTELVQKKEQEIKQKLESYFENERKGFGAGRRSSKAALDYYKNMNRSNVIPPQFMDKKK